MPIRAVIFDIGGVFSRHTNLAPLDPWVERLGMSAEDILQTVFGNEIGGKATLGQATVADVWDYANQTFGLSEDDKQVLIKDFWATMTWNTDLLDFVRKLKADYKIGALSDAWPDARTSNTEITPDLFDAIVYSAEEGIKKPNPEIYHRTLALLDVEPSEAIYVDDSPHKVEGADKVGMHAILYTDTVTAREKIMALIAEV